jgi:putative effector of murein hydrolase
MWTKAFWIETADRVIKSFAQGVAFVFAASQVGEAADAFEFDWDAALAGGLGMAILSLLTAIMSAPFGEQGSPQILTRPTSVE